MTTRETPGLARILAAQLLAAVPAAAGWDDEPAEPDPQDEVQQLIETIRAATEAFKSVDAATAAGYAPASPCVASPEGAMGMHYANNTLMDATVDPSRPELLLYEPGAGGSMTLIGVEFMVPAETWDPLHGAPPALAGMPFDEHRAEDARHGIPFARYELHVWAWRENPAGVLVPFNPDVSCR